MPTDRERIAELERELESAQVQLETARLALEAVAWYFRQRRFSVSPVSHSEEDVYLLHDKTSERYPVPLRFEGHKHGYWPSVYMAIKKAQSIAGEVHDGE